MYKAYFIELLKKYKLLVLVSCIAGLVWIPGMIIHGLQLRLIREDFNMIVPWSTMSNYLALASLVVPIVLSTMYQKMASVDFYNALPMKKGKRKLTETFFGWFLVYLPYIVGNCIVLVYVMNRIPTQASAYSMYNITLVLGFSTLYFLLTLILNFCNSAKESFINLMAVLCIIFILPSAMAVFVYSTSINLSQSDRIEMLSKGTDALMNLFGISYYTVEVLSDFLINSVLRLLLCVLLVYCIYRFASQRKAENCDTNHKNYRLFYTSIVFGSLVLSVLYVNDLNIFMIGAMVLFFGVIAFFFDQKKKTLLVSIGSVLISVCVVYILQFVLVQTEYFGNFRSYQDIDEEKTRVEITFDSYTDKIVEDTKDYTSYERTTFVSEKKEDLEKLSKIQDILVDHFKENYNKNPAQMARYIDINYYNKNAKDEIAGPQKVYMYTLNDQEYKEFLELCKENGLKTEKKIDYVYYGVTYD